MPGQGSHSILGMLQDSIFVLNIVFFYRYDLFRSLGGVQISHLAYYRQKVARDVSLIFYIAVISHASKLVRSGLELYLRGLGYGLGG
jgi:hypothetical protein